MGNSSRGSGFDVETRASDLHADRRVLANREHEQLRIPFRHRNRRGPSVFSLLALRGCELRAAVGVIDVQSGSPVSTSKLRRLRHGFSDRGHPLKAKRCSRVSPQALLPLRSKPRVRRKRAARPGPGGTWGHGMSTSQKTVQRGCILWAVSTSKLRCKSEKEVWFFNCGAYPALFPFRRRTDS